VVRITAVDALASHYLARQLADLRSRYPELAIEIIASSKSLDLVRREADIAVRLARPADGDLVVRCLGRLAYGVYGPEKPLLCSSWQTAPWVGYERALDQLPEMCWLSEQVGQHNVTFAATTSTRWPTRWRTASGWASCRAWSAASTRGCAACPATGRAQPRDLAGPAPRAARRAAHPRRLRLAGRALPSRRGLLRLMRAGGACPPSVMSGSLASLRRGDDSACRC
jgi:DNA-binding transcriptional LysR family regulator